MKHYFIRRKGNDSEKIVKSQREQCKITKHYRCHEDCNDCLLYTSPSPRDA